MFDLAHWTVYISALALVGSSLTVADGIRKRRRQHAVDAFTDEQQVVGSALALLGPYRQRVADLEEKLGQAATTIDTLKTQLDAANQRAKNLTDELQNAQAEIGYLRVQVSALSKQMPGQMNFCPRPVARTGSAGMSCTTRAPGTTTPHSRTNVA